MVYSDPGPLQYIFLGFMVLITSYLIFLYIKSKELHTYSCYNIIIMSFVIFSGGILNIFVPKLQDNGAVKFIWGLLKDSFNKLIMSILILQVIILYIGIIKTELYYSKEKLIFIIGIITCVGVSVVFGIVFNSVKVCKNKYHDYLDDYNIKKIEETDPDKCEDLKSRFFSIIIIELIFCAVILAICSFIYIKKK